MEAAIHPEWGVVDAVTDLLVKITLADISVNSVKCLCTLCVAAMTNKTTTDAGRRLVLTWIEKTHQKEVEGICTSTRMWDRRSFRRYKDGIDLIFSISHNV